MYKPSLVINQLCWGERQPLPSVLTAVTFSVARHHHAMVGAKIYCLVTETASVIYLPILACLSCYLAANQTGISALNALTAKLKKPRKVNYHPPTMYVWHTHP